MVDQPTFIYHFTHIEHLPSIIEKGFLSYNKRQMLQTEHIDIAHQDIQQRRAKTKVPCGPRGTLHDYIPFYFAPRSPMLYAIHKGKVENYQQGQEPLIYLVTTVQKVETKGQRFVFTDGHGIMALTEFFDNISHLDKVDWEVMKSRYWNDTQEYPDRCRRRAAEFLAYEYLPWEFITEIAVINERIKSQVTSILQNINHKPSLSIQPDWYY